MRGEARRPLPCRRAGAAAPRLSRCACPLRYAPHFTAQALRSCGVRQPCSSRVMVSGHPPPPAAATTCASATNALPCCSVRAVRSAAKFCACLTAASPGLRFIGRHRYAEASADKHARLPSAAAVPPPPLLRGWRRRLWLPLGDQRKLKNKSPAGAPAIQLAAKLCPWVDNRLCRLFLGGRFFGAARCGRPRDAPPRMA